MAAPIAIVHGWSDTSESFHDLRDYLTANGHPAIELWLADYISMDDDVRVEDVAKRMQKVLADLLGSGRLTRPFDLIVHSTGGLVAREWLMTFHPDGQGCPVRRLVMLAPANFGSALAATGKSFIGRVMKGWKNWFHTGQQMLNDLELASPYQWELARRDLLDPTAGGGAPGPYGPERVWPFVIVGSRGYEDGLRKIVNENGADGTVRVPAANMNVRGMTIDFTGPDGAPSVSPWSSRSGFDRIPFAVLPGRSHGSIIHPEQPSGDASDQLGELILSALRCEDADTYLSMAADWDVLTEETASLALDPAAIDARFASDPPAQECFHQYMQAIVRVVDDHRRPVGDYFLEFFNPGSKGQIDGDDADAVYLQREVLENVHPNSVDPSYRCLYIDRTDLFRGYYARIADAVAMSISAAPVGANIHFFGSDETGAHGEVVIHQEDIQSREKLDARLFRNMTHLIEIRIPRQPIDDVFKLAQ